MRQVQVDIEGDFGYCVPDTEIEAAIHEITSESDDAVNVLIVLGPFTHIRQTWPSPMEAISALLSSEGISLQYFRKMH